MTLKIEFYQKEDGTEPAQKFMSELDPKLKSKMYVAFSALENLGTKIREPYSKFIEDGIFELRAKQGTNICRILYFFIVGDKAILTNGFVKKTQTTPKNQIELAKKYREDYLKRSENND
jgi:phage-related protein